MKGRLLLAVFALLTVCTVAPTQAVTYGEPDGNAHPYVGVMLFNIGNDTYLCSGSLVAPTVFLTAGHCTFGASEAWVSVAEKPDYAGFPRGWIAAKSIHPHPAYNDFAEFPNTYDLGVVILKKAVSLPRYAQLPTLGFLDALATERGTQDVTFTVVGYGVNSYKPAFVWEGNRYHATSHLVNLESALTDGYNLMTSNNPGHDQGGTCSGDSGGPILHGASDMIVAVNSFGIAPHCKGNDYAYRVDIEDARTFLDDYLAVP